MSFVIINKKKYDIKKFSNGGNNLGYINFDKNKIGKILFLSEERKINKTLDTQTYNENPYREIEIHKQCNKIIKENLTANLVKFYKYYIYNDKIILIIEKYDGDLLSIINKLTLKQLWSIFFQIFITFIILQDKLGFYQGDFGLTNILYKKVNISKKYFYYKYNGVKYRVPNEGYKIAISDYGNAIINNFILADYEKEYYNNNISNRFELYEILLLLQKYLLNFKDTSDKNYRTKFNKLQDIIYKNIRFNLYNNRYTINEKYTEPADKNYLLENIFNK
jgi:hypothetical protein